jgi:2-amino-4-hydroxy-6-hydroxymethyldihydropteridine diphosphokinase
MDQSNFNQASLAVNSAIIGLGSNLQPDENMAKALRHLSSHFDVISVSEFKITAPIGITDQPDFLNGAARVNTLLSQEAVEARLKEIEDAMGRDRTAPKFGPRVMDLDLIVWNGQVVDPDYYSRDFLRDAVSEVQGDPDLGGNSST